MSLESGKVLPSRRRLGGRQGILEMNRAQWNRFFKGEMSWRVGLGIEVRHGAFGARTGYWIDHSSTGMRLWNI